MADLGSVWVKRGIKHKSHSGENSLAETTIKMMHSIYTVTWREKKEKKKTWGPYEPEPLGEELAVHRGGG